MSKPKKKVKPHTEEYDRQKAKELFEALEKRRKKMKKDGRKT